MMHGKRAFTLIELLVAATVTVMLAGVLIAVTSGALNIWRRAQSGLVANAQAKLVFDLIERDLQSALYLENGETLLAADISNNAAALGEHGWRITGTVMKPGGAASLRLQGDPNDLAETNVSAARFGLSGVWLRLVTTNVASGGSMPVVVSYQMARRAMSGGANSANLVPTRYLLFRETTTAQETVDRGYNVEGAPYVSELVSPGSLDALCSNVVDFGVWFYRRNVTDGSLVRIFPATTGDLAHVGVGQATASDASRYPDVADVMVRILSEEGAEQLENIENGRVSRPAAYASDAVWWWAVVESHSKVFVDRIIVGGSRS